MAFLRIGPLALVLVICLQFAFVQSGSKMFRLQCKKAACDEEEDNAKDCADSLGELFAQKVPKFLETSGMKNLTISNPPPCESCFVRGVEKLKLYQRTTSHLMDCGGGVKCVDHTLFFHVPMMDADCYCAMDPNPASTAVQMQEVLAKPNFGLKCDAPPEITSQLGKPDVKAVCGDPASFATMAECAPLPLPKLPGLGKRSTTKETGWVHAKWKDIKVAVSLRACSDHDYIVFFKADLDSPKPEEMTCECDGKPPFMAPCTCMVKANFLKAVLMQGIQFIFPCYCDEATKDISADMNRVQCKDFWF